MSREIKRHGLDSLHGRLIDAVNDFIVERGEEIDRSGAYALHFGAGSGGRIIHYPETYIEGGGIDSEGVYSSYTLIPSKKTLYKDYFAEDGRFAEEFDFSHVMDKDWNQKTALSDSFRRK